VLITDLQMPNLNGLELCTHLYSDAASAGLNPIPAILLTARSHDLESLGIAVPPNLKRIVSKPFSPRQLVLAVREVTGEATGNATGNSQGHAPGEAA
jgi:CheY-like chemotaxis protein